MADMKVEILATVTETDGCLAVQVTGKDGAAVEATGAQMVAAAYALVSAVVNQGCDCGNCGNIRKELDLAAKTLVLVIGAMVGETVTDVVYQDHAAEARH